MGALKVRICCVINEVGRLIQGGLIRRPGSISVFWRETIALYGVMPVIKLRYDAAFPPNFLSGAASWAIVYFIQHIAPLVLIIKGGFKPSEIGNV